MIGSLVETVVHKVAPLNASNAFEQMSAMALENGVAESATIRARGNAWVQSTSLTQRDRPHAAGKCENVQEWRDHWQILDLTEGHGCNASHFQAKQVRSRTEDYWRRRQR